MSSHVRLSASHQPHVQTKSQSQSQSHTQSSPQTQQSQSLYPWSAHTPLSGQSPSPFPRGLHALSTTATAAGELFLFGGKTPDGKQNDLYVISTRDFSTTLLPTSGDVPKRCYGHCVVLTSTTLLTWGGKADSSLSKQNEGSILNDLYLLNFISREWSRILINGPGPSGRYCHSMTLVGSKLFVFGGSKSSYEYFNDIWALDLNCLKSKPFWESHEPAPGKEKPLPRAFHISVTTGDRIIIFGGFDGTHSFNDTWSFNVSTRKWSELQCTGSIPSPRAGHAAVLLDDVIYVFGGRTYDGTFLGDLTALNLSTQLWTAFQDIGPSPSGRSRHTMACDETRVFVLGGVLSSDAQVNEANLIHALNTKLLVYPKSDSNTVEHSGKFIQPAQELSSSDTGEAHGAFALSGKQIARSEDGRLIELERQLSETLVTKTERDQRIEQLTEELALKSARLEQAEANVAEEKERAGLELRELQARLDESLLSRDHALKRAEAIVAEKKHAELKLHELQAKLDELLLSRDHALEQAQSALQKASCAAEANEQSQREHTGTRAELQASKSESAALRMRLADAENGSTSKAEADTYCTPTTTSLANMEVDRVVHRLVERMRIMEAEMASLRSNEKSFETMECSNED